MKIFIICPVRIATPGYKERLENYTATLEVQGHEVHLPHRDTDQKASAFEICTQNANAIDAADEVHIFYLPESQGIHFDLGVTFAKKKKIKIIQTVDLTVGKSFQNMLDHWKNL